MNTPGGYNATTDFEMCRMHYFWGQVYQHPSQLVLPQSERQRGIETLDKRKALAIGTCYHAGTEEFDKTQNPDAGFAAIQIAWDKECERYENLTPETEDVIFLLRKMLLSYLLEYKNDPMEVVALEREFAMPLVDPKTGETWIYTGKIDKLARYKGLLLNVERKTTSDQPAQFFPRFAFSRDITGYVAGANFLYEKEFGKVAGTLVEVCGKPRSKKVEAECWNRREYYLRSDADIALWRTEQCSLFRDIKRAETGEEPYRRVTAWCENWAGYHMTCQYKPLCAGGSPSTLAGVIEHGYQAKDWKS
jgi:hypothetical protein